MGRISRLGLRKKKIVEIIALVQKGMIDEKIASFYDSLGMFHRPVDLEKNEKILDEKTKDIRRAVLENSDISDAKKKILDDPKLAGSFIHIVPQDEAYHLFDVAQRVIEPVIKKAVAIDHEIDDPKEEALRNWIECLCDHEYCSVRKYHDANYQGNPNRNYYKFRVIRKNSGCKIPIPILDDNDRNPIPEVPYVLRRVHIQMPPRDFVPIFRGKGEREQRYEVPYQFFNFGAKLHDELLKNFAALLKQFEPPNFVNFSVTFDPVQFVHNPEIKAGKYLVSVATVRRKQLDTNGPIERLARGLDKNANKTQEEMRQTECRRLENGLKADDRFLDCLFPGSLVILGYVLRDGRWSRMKELSSFYDFLTCLPESVERFETSTIQSDFRTKLTERLVRAIPEQWKSDFTKQIENRIATIEQETRVRKEVLEHKIADRQKRIEEEINEQVIRLNFQPEKARLEEQLLLVRLQHDIRTAFLKESVAATNTPQIQRQLVVHFEVKIKE